MKRLKAVRRWGLANKECLVAAGELITAEARRQSKPLLPIDSEHNAVHQCLRGGRWRKWSASGWTLLAAVSLHTEVTIFCNHSGAGAEPSHVENGATDHHRLGNPNEQGI